MKVQINRVDQQTLSSFADLHDLTMVVQERDPRIMETHNLCQFYAHFKSTEVKFNTVLSSESGQGDTVEDAVNDYARRIEGRHLIVDAYEHSRREIRAPFFTGQWSENNE